MPKELLIADANVTAQEEFEDIFGDLDYQLIFAENGEDALLKIKLYKPDLVIADVTMKNKDGFELCKIVKADPELGKINFVLLAGIFEEIDKSERDRVGADGVITKPLKGEEILPLVKNLLETGPTPLRVEEPEEPGPVEAGSEETVLSMEGLSTLDGLEEVELSPSEETSGTQAQGGEDEQAIIDLMEVVDEETSETLYLDEGGDDLSSEPLMAGQEDLMEEILKADAPEEESLEGLELEEPVGEKESEGVELTETGGPQEGEGEIGEAEIDIIEGLEFEMPEEDELTQGEGQEPLGEAVHVESEEEIDRRIDLVLEDEGQGDEEDTLLEMEGGEEKGPPVRGIEELESLAEQIAQGETSQPVAPSDESLQSDEEALAELGEIEQPEGRLEGEESIEALSVSALEETVEEETPEPSPSEAKEKPLDAEEEFSDRSLEAVSDDLEALPLEGLESLGEAGNELEELHVEEGLDELLGEGSEESGEPGHGGGEKSFEADTGGERPSEVLAEEPIPVEEPVDEVFLDEGEQVEELVQEVSLDERIEEGVDEKGLTDSGESLEVEAIEEVEDESLEEGLLEEGLEGGESLLEEPLSLEEPAPESAEPPSYPRELIKEEHVSEEEIEAFQKRLSRDFLESVPSAEPVFAALDDRIESTLRKAVEKILKSVSESVVPELTETIIQIASERIEEVVQKVVPELAEGAIKKEIERLQKGN